MSLLGSSVNRGNLPPTRRLCFNPRGVANGLFSLILQLFEQALEQMSVHLEYLDPTADVLDGKVHFVRLCTIESYLQPANLLQVEVQLAGKPGSLCEPLIT
jgi:hypothetical protein